MMMYVLTIVFLQGIEAHVEEKLDAVKLRLGTASCSSGRSPKGI
jgi:hypothetical protein